MDWLKLFALLVAVASVPILADGPKKKIRIHLPQKVKHIHHHKKIYITQHPAASQYAPAYLPSAEGAVAVATSVALPASAAPLGPIELYDEARQASRLLPLYRARGYYGPNHSEWDDQELDLAPPPDPTDATYLPSAFSAPVPSASSAYPPKRVKVVKVGDAPRKKVLRKGKSKRVSVRGRPQAEDEHPVSTYHEQFYSDLDGSGTITKVKKPQRVEKIIDGDTEHIHTYSEEHIHKVVFDEQQKVTGLVGPDGSSISALSAAHPLLPIKNSQTLLAVPADSYSELALGSLGSPAHLEYAAYSPRDVTHDHIFHDHGEIPTDLDITKDPLAIPPKASYNSQGIRIVGATGKRHKSRHANKYPKPTKPTSINDFSYYESIYTPLVNNRFKKPQRPAISTSHIDSNVDYNPIAAFKFKDTPKALNKYRSVPATAPFFGTSRPLADFRLQQASVPAPFTLSSAVIHDYKPAKSYAGTASASGTTGFSNFKDPFTNYKTSFTNNFDFDTYASSSNLHSTSDDKNEDNSQYQGSKNKKKSVSKLNVNFGGHDQLTYVDHLEDSSISGTGLMSDGSPSALDFDNYDQPKAASAVTPTAYTIKESSPAHHYYTEMAIKALHAGDHEHVSMPEASNDNFQYAEPPSGSTSNYPAFDSTTEPMDYFSTTTESPEYVPERQKRRREKTSLNLHPRQRFPVLKDMHVTVKDYQQGTERPRLAHSLRNVNNKFSFDSDTPTARGKLKYGDKL